jgi:hypothetical protein
MSKLPLEQMVHDAHSAMSRLGTLGLGPRMTVGDLACHVLALAEEVERLEAEGPFRPKTLVHRPGGKWDAYESPWHPDIPRRPGDVEAWGVSEWRVHREAKP